MSLEQRFQETAARAKGLPNQGNTTLLELYGLFKQGSKGDATGSRPGMFDMVGRAKYDQWATLKGMSQEDAMEAYIALVEKLEADA